jgi:hypothetical protein
VSVVAVTLVAFNPAGAVGACVSGVSVVALMGELPVEFPAASFATYVK